jgi:hypothetical protein
MAKHSGRRDPPNCREDLVRKAAADSQTSWYAFWWVDERAEILVTENTLLTATEIRNLAVSWILGGGKIKCVPEGREGYRDKRHFHYDIIIEGIDGYPRGLYVYMELCSTDEDVPTVNLLNAHKP